jgi:hypothetical protein
MSARINLFLDIGSPQESFMGTNRAELEKVEKCWNTDFWTFVLKIEKKILQN